jgi:hypothetical protein
MSLAPNRISQIPDHAHFYAIAEEMSIYTGKSQFLVQYIICAWHIYKVLDKTTPY